MDTLKMRFKLNGLEFELEGKEETVKSEFENFKEFVSNKLLNRPDVITTNPTGPTTSKLLGGVKPVDLNSTDVVDIPILKEIVKKDLPKTEPDWILIYAFYATEYGDKMFTEKDIKDKYQETGRTNESRLKNLSNNLKSLLNKEYIKLHNDTEYLLKQTGIDYCNQIITGNSTSKSIKKEKTKSTKKKVDNVTSTDDKEKKKSAKSSVKFVDLDLKTDQIESLTTFYKSKEPKTQNEEVAVVMKWYANHMGKAEISIEEINYLLSICSKVPSALEQVLINMKGSKYRWVSNTEDGKVKLSSIGDSFVLTKLPKTTK